MVAAIPSRSIGWSSTVRILIGFMVSICRQSKCLGTFHVHAGLCFSRTLVRDTIPYFASVDPEFLHPIEKRATFQTQAICGAIWTTDASPRVAKGFDDSFLLFEITYNRRRVDC